MLSRPPQGFLGLHKPSSPIHQKWTFPLILYLKYPTIKPHLFTFGTFHPNIREKMHVKPQFFRLPGSSSGRLLVISSIFPGFTRFHPPLQTKRPTPILVFCFRRALEKLPQYTWLMSPSDKSRTMFDD